MALYTIQTYDTRTNNYRTIGMCGDQEIVFEMAESFDDRLRQIDSPRSVIVLDENGTEVWPR